VVVGARALREAARELIGHLELVAQDDRDRSMPRTAADVLSWPEVERLREAIEKSA